jgi:hypothetical protein
MPTDLERDIRETLHARAGHARAPMELPRPVRRRARRRRIGSAIGSSLIVAGIVAGTVVGVRALLATRAPGEVEPGKPGAFAAPPPSYTCDFPRYRPTYLPWMATTQDIPEPNRERTQPGGGPQGSDPGYADLVWGFGDVTQAGGPLRKGTLSLSRATESVGVLAGDPDVPRLPDGGEGHLFRGPADTGWSIIWGDPFPSPYDDPCSETNLSLTMPNLSSAEVRDEILKVARSLVLP